MRIDKLFPHPLSMCLTLLLGFMPLLPLSAAEWSGYFAGELRYFPHDNGIPDSYDGTNVSLLAEPEFRHDWDNGYQVFNFVPFVRVDQHDSERTHFDIRELAWIKAERDWELRVGIRKIFWGVTESQHLVDIINQTDDVENPDGEDKLGQPMLNLALIRDFGNFDFFLLPGFRERTFPSLEGRLQPVGNMRIDTDNAQYESSAEQKHVDWAVRWSHTLGLWDIGIAHFSGTSRDPEFRPQVQDGQFSLVPYYAQIDQTSLDVQATQEEALWKLELISRDALNGRYTAFTGGIEYTLVGIFESSADLGLIAEYLFDDRGEDFAVMEDDIMVGLRLTLNDIKSSELLIGGIFDRQDNGRAFSLEGSRRLGDSWKLSVEARLYSNAPPEDLAYSLRNEDYLQIELAYYF